MVLGDHRDQGIVLSLIQSFHFSHGVHPSLMLIIEQFYRMNAIDRHHSYLFSQQEFVID